MARINDTRQPDKIDSEAFQDYVHLRSNVNPLTGKVPTMRELVMNDLEAHEEFCDNLAIDRRQVEGAKARPKSLQTPLGNSEFRYILISKDDGEIDIWEVQPSKGMFERYWIYKFPREYQFTLQVDSFAGLTYLYELLPKEYKMEAPI